jgi:F-type H+-transporting ATPase subunit gamma
VSQKDIKDRISSVQNIEKITRAMEMVAAARLRKAEQRIEALRPYADAIRRMTRRATAAAENVPNLPLLTERENVETVGILLVTGDRGLAGPFNSRSSGPVPSAAGSCAPRGRTWSGTRWGRRASPR